jgi:hypothetical protein
MDTTQEHVMGLTQEAGFEVSTAKLEARLEELEKARRRADRELLEWKMQLKVADQAMCAGGILEASAEEEHRLAAIDLNTLQTRIELARYRCQRGLGAVLEQRSIENCKRETRSVEREASRCIFEIADLQETPPTTAPNAGPGHRCVGQNRTEE